MIQWFISFFHLIQNKIFMIQLNTKLSLEHFNRESTSVISLLWEVIALLSINTLCWTLSYKENKKIKQMFTVEKHAVTQISEQSGQHQSWFNFIVFGEKLIGFIVVSFGQYEVEITLFICITLMMMRSWFISNGANQFNEMLFYTILSGFEGLELCQAFLNNFKEPPY